MRARSYASWRVFLRLALPLLLLSALAACAGRGGGVSAGQAARDYAADTHYYPPPGPPGDPWGPYVQQASARFRLPAQWIRAVMHQESGGHEYLHGEPITSSAGAMGLMQIMPATYETLRAQYGLGDDPYDPHDNIMAGAGYIRQMYDRYGSPGFLAAYNAGPQRLDTYLAGGGSLPSETVNYVASISPNLGGSVPASGAFAEYAMSGRSPRGAGGCASVSDGAYDPSAPCGVDPPAAPRILYAAATMEAAPAAAGALPATGGGMDPALLARAVAAGGCAYDPDGAYDPSAPCGTDPAPAAPGAVSPAPQLAAASPECPSDPDAAYQPGCAPALPSSRATSYPAFVPAYVPPSGGYMQAGYVPPAHPRAAPSLYVPAVASMPFGRAAAPSSGLGAGAYAIQVGAMGSPDEARRLAARARVAAPELLDAAHVEVGAARLANGATLYRARLAGIDSAAAADACARLRRAGSACMIVPP